jgi:hypothetical protein
MGSGSTYILEPGSAQSQLASNAGKRVEVTGTVDSSSSMSSGSTGSGTTSSGSTAGTTGSGTTAGAAGSGSTGSSSSMSGQHLRVSSVRVVGESCSSR